MPEPTPTVTRLNQSGATTASTSRLDHQESASRRQLRNVPELLAPAGDWDCARAAVENGADAIYFGLEKFNARMRAQNFTEVDLPALMDFLHRRGVRGYVTLNTLVFENELADAARYLRTMIAAGVDAVIVQDVGICRLIRTLSPDFPIHASTQMTITSSAGVEFARELGCTLVVLARECSLKEIGRIQHSLEGAQVKVPLEVFVHGALCVAYSGQCLTSEALGGRSANRGECAQACRMPYELLSDGKVVPLGDRKYLLSPQDLAGIDLLPMIAAAGVASLKIEGRLKSPEYVANVTRVYRQALDQLAHSETEPAGHPHQKPAGVHHYDLEMAFSRGLYSGWFGGVNNQELVHGRFGKKRGVFVGTVTAVFKNAVRVRLDGSLNPGDGVVFDAGHPEGHEEGGRVYEVNPVRCSVPKHDGKAHEHRDIEAEIRFGDGDIDFSCVHVGDRVWKTSDPVLDRRLRQTYEGDAPKFQRPIDLEARGEAGAPLTVVARDEFGNTAAVRSAMPLEPARTQPLSPERLRDQLGRLGGTPFQLRDLDLRIASKVILPISELNRMRREIVAELERARRHPQRWTLTPESPLSTPAAHRPTADKPPELIVLVRNLIQLEAALQAETGIIYCDFEDPKKYREGVRISHEFWRDHCPGSPVNRPVVFVAPPRIFKMGEEWTLQQVRSSNADGYLVRNYDHLRYFADSRRVGDFSLNIANHLSADYFKNNFELERVTASYDLNFHQLESLLRAAPPDWFEVTIHQHMPMFHMEHCVFCAFLSSGTDFTNCGRPCDRHDLKLRDRVGAEHPVKADVGCRNTVFNGVAQTGAEYVTRLMALGVRHFRIEFVNETASQVTQTITQYRKLIAGEISGEQLWQDLKVLNQLGVTRGQMGR